MSLYVGHNNCYLLQTHLRVHSEGCWACRRESNETDDGAQDPCPTGGWQGLLEPHSLRNTCYWLSSSLYSLSLPVSIPASAPKLSILA